MSSIVIFLKTNEGVELEGSDEIEDITRINKTRTRAALQTQGWDAKVKRGIKSGGAAYIEGWHFCCVLA